MTVGERKPETGEHAVSPDDIIESIGGCGRFQVRMSVIVHLIKTVVCFTFTGMIIISSTPPWWCKDHLIENNLTSCTVHVNKTTVNYCPSKSCNNRNNTDCQKFGFDSNLNTMVNEFNLVCDRDYIPSTINSVQLTGVLIGNVVAGHIADLFGRKPPFFTSLLLLFTFNLVGSFSVSWEMFAIARFFAGTGAGFFLTTQYCLLSEFTLAKWRVWVVGFPSWPIQSCLFSLLAWLLHDWRYIQLMTALMALPCFFAWCVIPESFRWFISHDKPERADVIIRTVAEFNKHTAFDIDKALQKSETREDQKYTVLDLFRTKKMAKMTFLLSLTWFALGLVAYGIAFGIQSLSGNIFFNLFLFSLTGIPSKVIALWLQNRIGRRYTSILCFTFVAVAGTVVGIVQTLDVSNKDVITNAFALVAHMGTATAWGTVQTMTIEIYPTVIRNIGFGTMSVAGRIGAIAGPQLVYLNTYRPGLLYFVCGGVSFICIFGLFFLPETMDRNLNDKIKHALGSEVAVSTPDTTSNRTEKDDKGDQNENCKNEQSSLKNKDDLVSLDVAHLPIQLLSKNMNDTRVNSIQNETSHL